MLAWLLLATALAGPTVPDDALEALPEARRAELLDEETALALARAEVEAAEAALASTLQEIPEPEPTPQERLEEAERALEREKARRKRGETSDVPGAKAALREARAAAKAAPEPMVQDTLSLDDLITTEAAAGRTAGGGASKKEPAKSGLSGGETFEVVEQAVADRVEGQVEAQKALLRRARLAFYLAEAELQLARALAVVAAGAELDLKPYQDARDQAVADLMAEDEAR